MTLLIRCSDSNFQTFPKPIFGISVCHCPLPSLGLWPDPHRLGATSYFAESFSSLASGVQWGGRRRTSEVRAVRNYPQRKAYSSGVTQRGFN